MEDSPRYVFCYRDDFENALHWNCCHELKNVKGYTEYEGFRMFRMGELGKELRMVTSLEEVDDGTP